MIVDANNEQDGLNYRVVRTDTGEVIPYVTYADSEAGEVRVLQTNEDGSTKWRTHPFSKMVNYGDGRWEHYRRDATGADVLMTVEEVEEAENEPPPTDGLRVPFQIVEWPGRKVVAEWAP
jgi:hypothetical protein